MSIKNVGQNKWFVRVRTRINGEMKSKKQTVYGDRNKAKEIEVLLKKGLGKQSRSFTIKTLEDALNYYEKHTKNFDASKTSITKKIIADIGGVDLNNLPVQFSKYQLLLKSEVSKRTGRKYSVSMQNMVLSVIKTALNFCVDRKIISENPLQGFKKEADIVRDRILSSDEELRLLNTLRLNDSRLYWPVVFALKNPIRRGDLMNLTRVNLDRTKPWIHFYAQKTRRRKPRETVLPFLDNDLLKYFDSLPADCPYLFPAVINGKWRQLNADDFKIHWHDMLKKANIQDFHFHDLKHCSTTWMLNNGHTERDLMNLGVQFSREIINRYYHFDANTVLDKWKNNSHLKQIKIAS